MRLQAIRVSALSTLLSLALSGVGAAFAHTATAEGQVQKIDNAASEVEMEQGPIKARAVYRIRDSAILKMLRAGDRVEFDFDHDAAGYIITRVRKK